MNLPDSAPKVFPFAFEEMGSWHDSITLRRKTWLRFFSTDRRGHQVGRDAFSRLLDPIDCLVFMCLRGCRTAALNAGHWNQSRGYKFWVNEGEDLNRGDRERIAEILQDRKEMSS